jgi:hypothetical protein
LAGVSTISDFEDPPSTKPSYYECANYGREGLDNSFFFPAMLAGQNPWAVNSNVIGADGPSISWAHPERDGGGTDWYKVEAADSMTTWVMYKPPSKDGQPTTWVPLKY